ncbi:hypothetical protein GOP47_0017371 [Adiantum capillus-veneris]|uniref:Enoyl reductase (ER) domain-containing protein n=1 Tax=Adiantum capillus-veneris TaxID=13818 RepID=A0A9D4UG38_ADICA|nr:hypothetical protein GOP47_0017371 [Adiantum capillus-veneris]
MAVRRRAIVQRNKDDPLDGGLELVHLDAYHAPPPGHVCVRLTHRPINPSDHNSISMGRLFNLEQTPPIPGCEGCGLVHEVGEGVSKVRVGERVVPLIFLDYYKTGNGSWQDFITLRQSHILQLPAALSDEVAAQSILNPWTAYGLLADSAVPPGEFLLQTAAASVLGRQVIQLARHLGIKTINIVRRDKWISELKALGADEVINSEKQDIVAEVKAITMGRLAYGAIDAVGGDLTKSVASCVRSDGTIYVYGVLSGWNISLSTLDLMRGVRIRWWLLSNYLRNETKVDDTAVQVMTLLTNKILTPLPGKSFPLENFGEALRESKKEARGGKIMLVG